LSFHHLVAQANIKIGWHIKYNLICTAAALRFLHVSCLLLHVFCFLFLFFNVRNIVMKNIFQFLNCIRNKVRFSFLTAIQCWVSFTSRLLQVQMIRVIFILSNTLIGSQVLLLLQVLFHPPRYLNYHERISALS